MGKYIKKFDTHSDYEDFIETEDFIKPNISYCEDNVEVHYNPMPHDYSKDYLTTVALEDGTISFDIWKLMGTDMITSISYSTDDGETWTTTANQNNKQENLSIDVDVEEGDKVMWKGIATQTGYYYEDYDDYIGSFFSSDCEFDVKGNVMSLLYGDDFKDETTIEEDGTFCRLFYDYDHEKTCSVVNAKDLSLPATTLVEGCYRDMFLNCTSLTTAPELPATILANGCYDHMFGGCTNLTTAPSILPATTLANYCYNGMFSGCISLVNAPELPATTLADYCYSAMFDDCTSLVNAPSVLPATTLAEECYAAMFLGCTSLTIAPVLPATTLVEDCYTYMFKGCTSLNYIKAMFTTTPSSTYTSNWVENVASTGTFVKNSAASWTTTGINGIPTGWTVQTASA